MNLERIFKNLILIYPVLIVLILSLATYIDWDIPVESYTETTTIETIGILLFSIWLINLYFLYKFKPIGKTLFIPLLIILVLFDISMPYESLIMTPGYEYIESTFTYIDGILDGIIIALLYFTNIKDKFKKT
jgi:hypothetical protein